MKPEKPNTGSTLCVVTGGAGFIGSHVVDQLVRKGFRVRVVDDLSVGRLENIEKARTSGAVSFVRADVRDLGALRPSFAGADVVFHLAVQCLRLSLIDPTLVHEVNATGTLTALQAAREAGVRRFIYVSSSEVYGSARDTRAAIDEEHPLLPTTPYGASKAAGELYTEAFRRSYGLRTTVVRPFNSYGPRSHAAGPYGEVIPRFVARILAGEPPVIFGDGTQTRDFTYVEDTALGIVSAASDTLVGETVNVARGREVSIALLAETLIRICGARDLRPVHVDPRPGDVHRHLGATAKAERLMGFRAHIDLEEGLSRYMAWVRKWGIEVTAREASSPNWQAIPTRAAGE